MDHHRSTPAVQDRGDPMVAALLTPLLLLLLAFGSTFAQGAPSGPPSAWCDEILPTSFIAEVALAWDGPIERRVPGWVEETDSSCVRVYHAEGQSFSDELIFLLTSGYSAEGGARNVDFIAEGAEEAGRPVAWIEDLGHRAVRFSQPDPLRSTVWEFNVSFAVGQYLVELKYMNADDGLPTKLFQSLEEVEALARLVADRLLALP